MIQNYVQLKKQIADLQTQADNMKRSEIADVIAQAKLAIAAYGLTREDLFGKRAGSGANSASGAAAAPVKQSRKSASVAPASKTKAGSGSGSQAKSKSQPTPVAAAKYVDGKGSSWGGRGPRPQWLNSLLAAGARLEDFLAEKLESMESSAANAAARVSATLSPTPAPVVGAAARKGAEKPARKVAAKGAEKIADPVADKSADKAAEKDADQSVGKASKVGKVGKAAKTSPATKSATPAPAAAEQKATRPRYSDDAGHSWSGFGPKPGWLKDALAAGKKLEDFVRA